MKHDLYDIWEEGNGPFKLNHLEWRLQLKNYAAYFGTKEAAEQYRDTVKAYLKKQLDNPYSL